MALKSRLIWMAVLLLILAMNSFVRSQGVRQTEIIEASRSGNCEFTSAIFDSFAQSTAPDKTIIIIGHKGKKETRNNIVLRRLHNAKTYLTEYYKKTSYSRSPEKVITASSFDFLDEGRLDFWVDGELKLSILFRHNRDLDLSPCYVDSKDYCEDTIKGLFYPCLDQRKNGKKD